MTRVSCLAAAAAAILISVGFSGALAQEKVTVAVTAIVEHPSLDATRDGVKKALEDAGYKQGTNLDFQYQSAQGQPSIAAQIAQKFVGEKPSIIVPISTPSSQAVVAATQDIPVVFTAVTDPVGAQLIKDPAHPGGNVTGVAAFSPVDAQLDLIREILPKAVKIGVPFNPGEANSVAILAALKKEAAARNMEIIEAPATKSSDVAAAVQNLVGKVDVIYMPTDNTIVTALDSLVAIGTENKLPVFCGDNDSVARGIIGSVGFDYFQVGVETGKIVVRILKGEKPGDIAVVNAKGSDIIINVKAATAMGVTVPQAVLSRAHKVIQ